MSRLNPGDTIIAVDPGTTGALVSAAMRHDDRLDLISYLAWKPKRGDDLGYHVVDHRPIEVGPYPWEALTVYDAIVTHLRSVLVRPARISVEGLYIDPEQAQGGTTLGETAGLIMAGLYHATDMFPQAYERPLWRQWVHIWRQGTQPGAKALEEHAVKHAHRAVLVTDESDWLAPFDKRGLKWARGHLAEAAGIALFSAHRELSASR